MRHFASLLIFSFLALLLLSACTVPAPTCDQEGISYPSGAHLAGDSLHLGIIDASRLFVNDLPGALRTSQATLAALDDVRWGYIEPSAPQDGAHDYVWNSPSAALDARVAAYQNAGFELVMVLRAWNPWARSKGPEGGQAAVAASTPPRPEYLDDYEAWVQAVVERYDGDGVDDFQGLVDVDGDGHPDPVRYFQIETDATTGVWWQGTTPETTAAEYITLLRAAASGARRASPHARILIAGSTATDMLDRGPDASQLEEVVTSLNPAVCGAITAFQQIVAASDAYDIIAVHSMADYSGLPTLANWVATVGGESKPVWLVGATSAPALTADPQLVSVNPLYPLLGEALWESLRDVTAPNHDDVVLWYRAEQARLAFKKWVMAAVSGFDAILMGYEQDRPNYQNPDFGLRDLAFQGMTEPGDGTPEKRPVIYALAMAQSHLSGYTDIQPIAGLPENVVGYTFTVEGQPVNALWYDDGVAAPPSQNNEIPVSKVLLTFHTPDDQLLLFITPTQPGQTSPTVWQLTPENGVVNLMLDQTPVILRGHIEVIPRHQQFLPLFRKCPKSEVQSPRSSESD